MLYSNLNIIYQLNGKTMITSTSDDYIDISCDTSHKGRIKVLLSSKANIQLVGASVHFSHNYKQDDAVFANGYQSWTYSREYSANDIQYGLKNLSKLGVIRSFIDFSGDYQFVDYPEKNGEFHSFSYGYIRSVEKFYFIGSLTERYGWSIIRYSFQDQTVVVQKDIKGIKLESNQNYELFDLLLCEGGYDEIFDKYFDAMDIPKPKHTRLNGYTSWYNYYGKISQDSIMRDLRGIQMLGNSVHIIQIDEGYQSAVGDWLDVKKDKFPNGMKYIADKIHEAGYKASLWIAPTLCQRNSKIAKQHPNWLVKTSGKWNSLGGITWGGAYILDLEKQEVRDYIAKVIDTILNEWGFDVIKLDYLYSSCLHPRHNKTRGQLMQEAMEFFRQCAGDKLILASGVPLASAFGNVDFCRVGCENDLTYYPKFWTIITNQEIVCTQNSITNTIFRRHLNGRAFTSDVDVFFVRDSNLRFSPQQKQILQTVNSLFGGVLFVSDNVGEYSGEQLIALNNIFNKRPNEVIDARWIADGVVTIEYYEYDKTKNSIIIDIKKGEIIKK